MRINKEDVQHVGRLARLHLSDEEIEAFSHQLSNILDYMDELREVEASGVHQPEDEGEEEVANVFREDVPEPSLPQEKAVANGPEIVEGFFSVPKIIGNR